MLQVFCGRFAVRQMEANIRLRLRFPWVLLGVCLIINTFTPRREAGQSWRAFHWVHMYTFVSLSSRRLRDKKQVILGKLFIGCSPRTSDEKCMLSVDCRCREHMYVFRMASILLRQQWTVVIGSIHVLSNDIHVTQCYCDG